MKKEINFMTIKDTNQKKAQIAKYIQQLDDFNWHHPTQSNEMADSQFEHDQTNYYLAQLSHVLINTYPLSYNNVGRILNIGPKRVKRLMASFPQELYSIKEIQEELQNGEENSDG